MLQRLRVKNFQKHAALDIEFDPKITTLIGATDAGKSAVLRALKWVCTNTPNGDDFIRHGQESTSVSLYVDGRRIRRRKGKENSYSIDDKKFVAFRADVPEEIAELLNVTPTTFQGQFDAAFWLSESPGQVAKNLNKIINLEIIDTTLANIASTLRKSTATVDVSESRLKDAKETATKLKWVSQFDRDLTALEQLADRIDAKRTKIDSLASILADVASIKTRTRRAAPMIVDGLALLELGRQIKTKAKKINELAELLTSITVMAKKCESIKTQLSLAKTKLKDQMTGECPVCGKSMDS